MLFCLSFISAATPFGLLSKAVTLFVSAYYMGRFCKIIIEDYRSEE